MKQHHVRWSSYGLSATVAVAAIAAACGSNDTGDASTFGSGGGGNGGAGASAGSGGAAGIPIDGSLLDGAGGTSSSYPCSGCQPFPGIGTKECDPSALAPATIAYPPDGVLLPPNMNVLEVQFTPPAGATLFEVDFENSVTDVRVETQCDPITPVRGGASTGCGLTLPQAAWNDIANTNRDGDPVHVSVRATADGSCVTTSTTKIDVSFAKDDLAGGIYYWQSATYGGVGGTTGGIYSHDFGTFDPTPTPFYTSGATGTCVGCHNLSRDGERIAVATDDPDADDEFGDMHTHMMDVTTRTVFGGTKMSPGFQTFTHDHAKMIASTYKTAKNASFQVFDGDTAALIATPPIGANLVATQPDLSHDDANLVYVVPQSGSISSAGDHHFMAGSLYASTFDASTNALGAPTLLLGATAPQAFYYPSFSPDGHFVVFDEAPDGDVFWNRKARVKLAHFPGANPATPIDLPSLNLDPSVANSWPRWSPFVQTYKGHKLLWVTFSSNRDYGLRLVNKGFDNCYPPESPSYDQPQPLSKQGVGYETCAQPQIWMAAVLVDEDAALDAKDRSFPAFWLPFQDVTSHNFCAQWVEKIYGDQPDGGTDAGGCGTNGSACSANALCCADQVCCNGSCVDVCVQ
jgi:hypothetical protein